MMKDKHETGTLIIKILVAALCIACLVSIVTVIGSELTFEAIRP